MYQNPNGISLMVSCVGYCPLQADILSMMLTSWSTTSRPSGVSIDQSISIRECV